MGNSLLLYLKELHSHEAFLSAVLLMAPRGPLTRYWLVLQYKWLLYCITFIKEHAKGQ